MKIQGTSKKSAVCGLQSAVYPPRSSVFGLQSKVQSPRSAVCSLRSAVSPKAGFTLLEMLVVVSILLLLAGLILAGVNVARDRAKELRARRDVAQLKTALGTYYADYSAFPNITEADSKLGAYYITGTDLIQTLRGREGHKNPKRIPYMDFHQRTTTFNDPWGNKYRVSMDTDYDGDVAVPGGTIRQSVVAWSAGKDGVDGTKDDVKTWRD